MYNIFCVYLCIWCEMIITGVTYKVHYISDWNFTYDKKKEKKMNYLFRCVGYFSFNQQHRRWRSIGILVFLFLCVYILLVHNYMITLCTCVVCVCVCDITYGFIYWHKKMPYFFKNLIYEYGSYTWIGLVYTGCYTHIYSTEGPGANTLIDMNNIGIEGTITISASKICRHLYSVYVCSKMGFVEWNKSKCAWGASSHWLVVIHSMVRCQTITTKMNWKCVYIYVCVCCAELSDRTIYDRPSHHTIPHHTMCMYMNTHTHTHLQCVYNWLSVLQFNEPI